MGGTGNNLHVVAVTDARWRMRVEKYLRGTRDAVVAWAAEWSGRNDGAGGPVAMPCLHSLAVMPDHLHVALRGPVDRSPESLAESLWQRLNRQAGCQLFSDRIYVGTFSEYPLGVVTGQRKQPTG